MRRLLPVICLLFWPLPSVACEESYTSVPLVVMGNLVPGQTFKREISPGFYFAAGRKAELLPAPPIYLWLAPVKGGWLLTIGPHETMMPDYIAVTALPYASPIALNAAAPPKHLEFCFTMVPQDYKTAVSDLMAAGESGVIDILSKQCRENDEGVGHGKLTVTSLPGASLSFEADLRIPVNTTDCPPSASRD